ncbi:hypothetical protein [Vibrio taketomensis]|uniref:hypothetical protein n=1 Tax=Vibrio taketomensis TaxID=2572923 RepID=UPI00138A27A1|nr:hypothetical protein [Vibrio taketomensis]
MSIININAKHLLAASLSLALVGCGNESGDKPATPNSESAVIPAGHKKTTINLSALVGQSGDELISGIESQLNAGLTTRANVGRFKIVSAWGTENLIAKQDNNGISYLETKMDARVYGKQDVISGNNNGFGFTIELPNGLLKNVILSYRYKLSTPLGLEAGQSADYIFMGGFTSGNPDVINKPTSPGSGFTYKFSTTRDKTINTYFVDAKDSEHFNKPLNFDDTKVYVQPTKWNLLQMNLAVNNFSDRTPNENGSVTLFYNGEQVKPNQSTINNRVQIDATHDYDLNVLFEFYRHHKNKIDADERLRAQTLQIRDLTVAWEDANAQLPAELQPDLSGYDHSALLQLDKLETGLTGSALITALEQQLNSNLPNGSVNQFSIVSTWGSDNLVVARDTKGKVYLETKVDAGVVGIPDSASSLKNGFGFSIKLPNGLVRNATLAYRYKYTTPLGTADQQSPDYIFMGGLASGQPSISNGVAAAGSGFSYKFSTTRDRTLNSYFADTSTGDFYNKLLFLGEDRVAVKSGKWDLLQMKLTTNDFNVDTPHANGFIDLFSNGDLVKSNKLDIRDRIQIDATHNYDLSVNFEFFRHFKNKLDGEEKLLEQTIQLRDLVVAWNDNIVELPPEIQPDLNGYQYQANVNLKALALGLKGDALITALENQLNANISDASAKFEIVSAWGANNLVVSKDAKGKVYLESLIDAGMVGKPTSVGQNNGFGFSIKLPNGQVRNATFAYRYKFVKPIGNAADKSKSADYIFLGGFNSGQPAISNSPSASGTGFTYKFSTDLYGNLISKFVDATPNVGGQFFNSPFTAGTTVKPTYHDWNLIQTHLYTNTYLNNTSTDDGSLEIIQNNKEILPNSKIVNQRRQIDTEHSYDLDVLFEFFRHYKPSSTPSDRLLNQAIQIRDIVIAWSGEDVQLPTAPPVPDPEAQPDLTDYTNVTQIPLDSLAGKVDNDLVIGIQDLLNGTLNGNPSITGQFTVTPNWGLGNVDNPWDTSNLQVVQDEDGKYVLKATIDAGALGKPADGNNVINGFSLLITLPNGLVRNATLAYRYKLLTPIGYNHVTKSPDYIYFGGFTSGNPAVINEATTNGAGFTYKFSTDRYGNLKAQFVDATGGEFADAPLEVSLNKDIRPNYNEWNLIQTKLKANDFVVNVPNSNGSLEVLSNNDVVTPNSVAVVNRNQIDAKHNYNLNVLFEFYRHYKHSSDKPESLLEQAVIIRDQPSRGDEVVTLPDVPTEPDPDLTPMHVVQQVKTHAHWIFQNWLMLLAKLWSMESLSNLVTKKMAYQLGASFETT